MIQLLVCIKHQIRPLWDVAEKINSLFFKWRFEQSMQENIAHVLVNYCDEAFEYRLMREGDLEDLSTFFQRQPEASFNYFKPHGFDRMSLRKMYRNHSFMMFGAFNYQQQLCGYFFLRCFINRHAFRGKIVDAPFRGQGIAKVMGAITTDICEQAGFRLFATVSKENRESLLSSEAANNIHIIKELPNNYVYLEYKKK